MPAGTGTRPTTDRVREAIFSAIAAWAETSAAAPHEALAGLGFCDLYAGSGAVGLEAASRGAAPVLLVEHDRRTVHHIRRTAEDLDLDVTIQVGDVPSLLRRPAPAQFDIVFADPPYDQPTEALDTQLRDLIERGWVAQSGLVILERPRRTEPPNWPVVAANTWARPYGETVVYFGSLQGKGKV